MRLSEVLFEGEYTSLFSVSRIEFSSVCTDTAKIKEGCLFVCVAGENYDTHKVIDFIARRGAVAIIAEKDAITGEMPDIPIFEVESTRRILPFIYSRYYGTPQDKMKIIGITGTNGKTSTSYMLRNILKTAGFKVGLIGTVECLIDECVFSLPDGDVRGDRLKTMTTPAPEVLFEILAKMQSAGITHVIMEVSSHALELFRVEPIYFECGIFTNLAPEHLDFHRDMQSYARAKAKLFSKCRYGIFNLDSEYADFMMQNSTCTAVTCGVETVGDCNAKDVKLLGSRGVEYTYSANGLRFGVKCAIPAIFTVYNSLLAICAALTLGVSPSSARDAIGRMKSVSGRLERIALDTDEYSVFIDYAHTEAALRNLLYTVRNFRQGDERIVLLFGCGGDRDKTKRAPMGKTAEELSDFVIVTTDNPRNEKPRDIIRDILSGMKDINKRRVILDRKKAIEYAIENAKKNDIIILAGKGHENYHIDDAGTLSFDERKIVENTQKKKKNGDNKK